MTTGWTLSGAAHVALMLYLLLGGLLTRDRLPEVQVAEVSVITEAEYAALVLRAPAPEVTEGVAPVAPPEPDPAAAPPEAAQRPEPAPPRPEPAPEPPPAEAVPVPPEPAPPEPVVPGADIAEAPPVIAPPTIEDGDTVAPEATPQDAPRVAPEPAPVPDPVAEAAPEMREAAAPEPSAEAEAVVEEVAPAAPEAATTEIVTEAETPEETAPVESIRPRARPPRPVRQAETPPETPPDRPAAPEPQPERDAIADAVAAAVAEAARPAPAASGPPMTEGERDALRVSVQACWNVGSLSSEALRTTVTVAVSVARDGRPETGSIRMIGFEGGSEAAARQAYEAARRAIIRCGSQGFALPPEKYDQWRDIEMTFNPERMRIR